MPFKSVNKALNLPIQSAADVRTLFEAGLRIREETSPSRKDNMFRDLGDYFFYIGVVFPEAAAALRTEFIDLSDAELLVFSFGLHTWLPLLYGAEDRYVEALLRAFHDDFDLISDWRYWGYSETETQAATRIRRDMLAAIGTPTALAALTELSHRHGWKGDLQALGFDVPAPPHPIRMRFSPWRRAILPTPFEGSEYAWRTSPNPIRLPLSDIVVPERETEITWHYLSLATSELPFLQSLHVPRLHLVSPRQDCMWTLFSEIEADGRYANSQFHWMEGEADVDQEGRDWLLERENETPPQRMVARLLPLDDNLLYCNSHLNWNGIDGVAGGPPGFLYPPPLCPRCNVVMFHVLTVDARIHEYGDAWRSLFVCEECRIAATHAFNWN